MKYTFYEYYTFESDLGYEYDRMTPLLSISNDARMADVMIDTLTTFLLQTNNAREMVHAVFDHGSVVRFADSGDDDVQRAWVALRNAPRDAGGPREAIPSPVVSEFGTMWWVVSTIPRCGLNIMFGDVADDVVIAADGARMADYDDPKVVALFDKNNQVTRFTS